MSGIVLSETRYMPFGAVRTDVGTISQTDFGYTFQRNLPDTGLMDYRARFYDPYINRFIQPDTIVPNPANPQSWNKFSYVENNPVRFVDPTGHMLIEGSGGGGGLPDIIEPPDEDDEEDEENVVDVVDDDILLWLLNGVGEYSTSLNSSHHSCVYYNYYCGSHDSWRSPDYINVTPGYSWPALGLLISVVTPLTGDRFGNQYAGIGIAVGPDAWAGLSGNVSPGWISDGPPGEWRTEEALSGWFFNVSGGFVGGGGWNSNYENESSWDLGVYSPQISVSAGYVWIVNDSQSVGPEWQP